MLKTIVAALAVAALALCAGAPADGAAAAKGTAEFEWSMPSRFGEERDQRGRIVETQPYEVRRGPWTVDLKVTGRACAPGAVHRWTAGNGRRLRPERLEECRFAVQLAREGTRRIRLDTRVGGKHLTGTRKVKVQDWLIVSLGDSVAAGESVPDVPGADRAAWQSVRCHRSARAGVALAAKQIEDDDEHSSVTFVHLACSGATVPAGLLGPYGGVEPPADEPLLEPQVSALNRIAAVRQVDAVLLSVGANDVHFGNVVRFCIKPADDCFAERLTRLFGGDGLRTVRETIDDALGDLGRRYGELAARISPRIPASRVHVVEYFDPTRDANGATCRRILRSIAAHELEQAHSRVLVPLNAAVARAARDHGWNLVDGVAQLFRNHGYCAGEQAWVTNLRRSIEELGGTLKGRFLGTLHPNQAGHEATSTLISAELERALYPGWTFPARPLPAPAETGGSASGGDGIGASLVRIVALILLGPALLLAAAALLTRALVGAVLWVGQGAGSLILLGFAAGALFLIDPAGKAALAATPFRKLAKTVRPLLLPLLVVIAVGTVKYSPAVQLLVSATLLVLAWKLIVVPEAERSHRNPRLQLGFLREIALDSGIAIGMAIVVGLGIVAVAAVKLLGVDNPYFDAIGDVASALLLLAVVLWAFALALRLFSFATGALRAVTAALLGLALIALAAGTGVFPGREIVGDSWPTVAASLAGMAVLLLAIDAVKSALAGPEPPVDESTARPITSSAAGAGFGAALVATVLLAASTIYGLIDAAERGQSLNPPEAESAEVRIRPLGAARGAEGMALAQKYAPVLVFAEGERWAPERVDSYVTDATLSGPPGTPRKIDGVEQLPRRCAERGRLHCYELSIDCESGDLPCAEGFRREKDRLYRDGAVYVRVLEKGRLSKGDPRDTFARRGPFRNQLEMLIQYWYFYRYNEWRAPVFAGLLIQRHEADWEAVTIGLDANRRPLFVANSAHCGGSWRSWPEVEASTRLPGPRTHPLVAVAEGSHANYPDPNQRRSPDWASCAGAPSGATTAVSYASNIRDKTEFGWLWYPPPNGWIEVKPGTPPMSFPGTWGDEDSIVLRNFTSNLLGDGLAPKTPTLQGLWQEPVKSIFCSKYTPNRCTRDQE